MAWTLLLVLLVLLAHCTGRDISRSMAALEWVSPSLSQTTKQLNLFHRPVSHEGLC